MKYLFFCLLVCFLVTHPLSAQTTTAVQKGENIGQVSMLLTERLKARGATEITAMHSETYLILRFRGLTDPEAVRKLLAGKRVEFRYLDEEGSWRTALTNEDLLRASSESQFDYWAVQVETTESGKTKLGDATRKLLGKKLSIFVDGEEISSPLVQEAITGGQVLITGRYTEKEATDLARSLNAKAELLELSTD